MTKSYKHKFGYFLFVMVLVSSVAFFSIMALVLADDEPIELMPQESSIPGSIQGTGTYFEIKDSEYLNVSLQSTEEITIRIESIPKTISLNLEASSVVGSTTLTLGNLELNKTYYKYQNSYKNEVQFTTDETGTYAFEQDSTQNHHIWFQEIKGTIFLPDQCTTYGTWDPITLTCTLAQDLNQGVEITASNITLDCDGHKITDAGRGIYLSSKQGVVVRNCTLNRNSYGIYLYYSNNNTFINNILDNYGYGIYLSHSNNNILSGNTASDNYYDGIYLYYGSNNTVMNNTVSNNTKYGINLYYSSNNTLTNNKMVGNRYNFGIDGYTFSDYTQNIDSSNLVDGKPVYYWINQQNQQVPADAGYVGIVNSENIIVEDLSLTSNGQGVLFVFTNNSRIENVNVAGNHNGIYLGHSNDNALMSNTASGNYNHGIHLSYSNNNILMSNIASGNSASGIGLSCSSNNTLTSNTASGNNSAGISVGGSGNNKNTLTSNIASDNPSGIYLGYGSNNTLSNNIMSGNNFGLKLDRSTGSDTLSSNTISGNNYGIYLFSSNSSTVINNTVSNNTKYGIYVVASKYNKIYHNNFKDNYYKPQARVEGGTGNLFDNGYPTNFDPKVHGGNFWSDYIGIDSNNDGIGDAPYAFYGGQDRYPFMNENGWAVPVNQPPTIQTINQYKSDGQTPIEEGETTIEDTVKFKAMINDPDNDQVKLQVELRQFNEQFNENDESAMLYSNFVPSDSTVATFRDYLSDGDYKWRYRAIDNQGNKTDWQEFGTAGNVDFMVSLPLSTKAANLAKELVNYLYLYGGKGWDYNQSEFVAPSTIKTGYNFWNQAVGSIAFGSGVDCSGLVMWAYDRSFNPLKSRFDNFVKAEGADEQYRYNTEITTEVQLRPGDVMFFDWNSDGFIDHVAMYIGESGVFFDVVNASSPAVGIIPDSKDRLKQINGFWGFKRVVSVLPPVVLATADSPVDLMVTDPDGFTITPTTIIPSNEEYLREIPGVLYYSEMERGTDGNPIDQVYSYTAKNGDYIIQVLPAIGASPAATYTLDFSTLNRSIVLAQNVPISQIPSRGYGITVSAGVVTPFIPVAIDIKPGSYPNSINLKSNGVVPLAIFGSAAFDVRQIDPFAIKLVNALVKLKNNGQPMASFEDVNGDGFGDLIVHVITKDLQLSPSNIKANLEGKLFDGAIIKGSDSVRIVP